jgi:hypothetical protein
MLRLSSEYLLALVALTFDNLKFKKFRSAYNQNETHVIYTGNTGLKGGPAGQLSRAPRRKRH